MKIITSKDNPIYKSALKLTRRKYRDAAGRFLLEGVKPLRDAIAQGMEIETVFIKAGILDSAVESQAGSFGIIGSPVNFIQLDNRLFEQLSDTENSQGIVSVALKPETPVLKGGNVVVLDRLQDPGNIGTIIRTAEAAGFEAVMTVPGTGDVYAPKTVRAAAGSILRMPVISAESPKQAVMLLHDAGLKVVVTALEGAEDCFQTEYGPSALVIGNEGSGVSQEFLGLADKKVKIPMKGEIESLNAAVAAGILMYEVR